MNLAAHEASVFPGFPRCLELVRLCLEDHGQFPRGQHQYGMASASRAKITTLINKNIYVIVLF